MNIKRIIGYIGSKVNLYPFIEKTILKPNKDKKLFIDLFAGTCAVSKLVKEKTNMDIFTNDLALYSLILSSELKLNELSEQEMKDFKNILLTLDSLDLIEGDFYHEFSMGGTPKTINDMKVFEIKNENYQLHKTSRMFFKKEVGLKIDTVRNYLKENKQIKEIEDLVLLFLLNYANSNSNNTSVYGAYLKHDKLKNIKPFLDYSLLEYLFEKHSKFKNEKRTIKSFNNLAEHTIDDIKLNESDKYSADDIIIYWDPPYNSRSYESNYHILEYLCDLDFNPLKTIKENSKSGIKVSEEKVINPFTSKVKTPGIFKDLISKSMSLSNLMYISYSNEGLMRQEDIENITNSLGLKLTTYTEDYKRFTSGENNGENNNKKNTIKEIIWKIEK